MLLVFCTAIYIEQKKLYRLYNFCLLEDKCSYNVMYAWEEGFTPIPKKAINSLREILRYQNFNAHIVKLTVFLLSVSHCVPKIIKLNGFPFSSFIC